MLYDLCATPQILTMTLPSLGLVGRNSDSNNVPDASRDVCEEDVAVLELENA